MDSDDLALFRRSIRHAVEASSGKELDDALEQLGWRDALEADPSVAIATLFELQGWANATSTALDHAAFGQRAVLPRLGAHAAPATLCGEVALVDGLAANGAPLLVVAASTSTGEHVAGVVDASRLEVRGTDGLDPSMGVVIVRGEVTLNDSIPLNWAETTRLAQLALGHELVGAARRMLELAREHALARIQFGRPIAAFQAVRHRLAETLVAVEAAESLLAAAWSDQSAVTASMAKAVAGRAARTAGRHCQQVLAGVGFTTEHPFHHYLRRVLVLDELFGSARSLTRELGEEILRSRSLPPMQPL